MAVDLKVIYGNLNTMAFSVSTDKETWTSYNNKVLHDIGNQEENKPDIRIESSLVRLNSGMKTLLLCAFSKMICLQ